MIDLPVNVQGRITRALDDEYANSGSHYPKNTQFEYFLSIFAPLEMTPSVRGKYNEYSPFIQAASRYFID